MAMEKERGMSSILLQYHSDRREEGGRGLGLSMSNALQVVTEALSSTTKLPPFCQIEIKREDCQPPAPLDNDEFEDDEDDEDDEEELQTSQQQAFQNVTIQQHQLNHNHNHPGLIGKTIVASDNDVTNGFVKDGKMLPYVFEANESGVRKRSSKILPVCGVCGKRFVCVTTMKRHLVTHTGEKPFSCKVCGKQYTQKGNLRVHERTHRNDRPFECNICHQKFYRKEPMQKHQWRQHGVVHFKSRPLPVGGNNNNNNNSSNPTAAAATATSATSATAASSNNNDNVLYTSLVDHIQTQQQHQQEKTAEKPSCYVRPLSEIVVAAAAPRSPLPSVAHLLSIPAGPPVHREFDQPKLLLPTIALPSLSQLQYRVSEAVAAPLPLLQLQPTSTSPSFGTNLSSPDREEEMVQKISRDSSPGPDAGTSTNVPPQTSPKPIKLRMKFAYQKEQEDINHKREEEERQILEDEENDEEDCEGSLGENLGELKLRSSSTSPTGHEPSTDSRAHPISDPFQCVGCCVVFAHKPALKAHQICPDEKERPFKCCKCGYKFRQKAHLQKHQWRIHRRRYCDQDESPAATTITMQDIINHGVEKSLREIPVYHGKTSSKYYSEILGLEYSGSDDNNSNSSSNSSSNDVQPLDLSPVKKKPETSASMASATPVIKIRELETNPLLNQPPLPRSPLQRLPEMASTFAMMTSGNDRSTSSLSISPSSISVVESFPAWKKQRTESSTVVASTTTTATTTHRALPPISILQKPPVMSFISRKTDGSTYTSYKHSSWIRETSNPVATDLSTVRKSGDQQQQNPDFLRDQLSRLQGQNARTV